MISQNLFQVSFLSEFLPYESFDPKTKLFHNKGTTGFVLKGHPMVGANMKNQDDLAEFFRRRENLKEGTSVQFLLFANPKCEYLLSNWASYRQKGMYRTLAERRAAFLNSRTKASPHNLPLLRQYDLYISVTLPEVQTEVMASESFVELREQLQEKLSQVGLPTEVMTAETFVTSFGEILTLNEEATKPFRWNKHESLSRQLSQPNQVYNVTPTHLELESGYHFKAFVPKISPSEWSLMLMDKFLGESTHEGFDFPYMLHYGLTICDGQSGERAKAVAKRESLQRSLETSLGKFIPTLKDEYAESLEVVEEMQRQEQVCYAGLSIGIFARPENLKKAESKLVAKMNRLGFEFCPTTYTHFPMLLSFLPMTWTFGSKKGLNPLSKETEGYGKTLYLLRRLRKTITREAQNMLPILGEWKGQNAPGLMLSGRQGQLFCWNPYGAALVPHGSHRIDGGYNTVVAGATGAGKSVALQEMANLVLSMGGPVFVFDLGRSFEKYCHVMNGQHIEFNLANPQCLNFFSGLQNPRTSEEFEIWNDTIVSIQSTVKTMASYDTVMSDLQKAYIDEAVMQVANTKGSQGNIEDIRQVLLAREEKDSKDLAQMLFSYSKEGMYSPFFNGEANVDFNAKLVVIESEKIKAHPSLMAVAVQMMIIKINQMMVKSDRKHPFMIIIDEAWQFLSGKGTDDFIPAISRTTRKYKGSIVLATQMLTDYFRPEAPAAAKAFKNADWRLIMRQPNDEVDEWESHENLKSFARTEAQRDHMKSIDTHAPYYSEMAIFGRDIQGVVGRLMLDPFSRIMYSTNADEFRRVNEHKASGMTILEAIEAEVRFQEESREVA